MPNSKTLLRCPFVDFWAELLALFCHPILSQPTHRGVSVPSLLLASPYLTSLSALLRLCLSLSTHPHGSAFFSPLNHSPLMISFTFVTSAIIPFQDTPNSLSNCDLAHELLIFVSDFLQDICSQCPLDSSHSMLEAEQINTPFF